MENTLFLLLKLNEIYTPKKTFLKSIVTFQNAQRKSLTWLHIRGNTEELKKNSRCLLYCAPCLILA